MAKQGKRTKPKRAWRTPPGAQRREGKEPPHVAQRRAGGVPSTREQQEAARRLGGLQRETLLVVVQSGPTVLHKSHARCAPSLRRLGYVNGKSGHPYHATRLGELVARRIVQLQLRVGNGTSPSGSVPAHERAGAELPARQLANLESMVAGMTPPMRGVLVAIADGASVNSYHSGIRKALQARGLLTIDDGRFGLTPLGRVVAERVRLYDNAGAVPNGRPTAGKAERAAARELTSGEVVLLRRLCELEDDRTLALGDAQIPAAKNLVAMNLVEQHSAFHFAPTDAGRKVGASLPSLVDVHVEPVLGVNELAVLHAMHRLGGGDADHPIRVPPEVRETAKQMADEGKLLRRSGRGPNMIFWFTPLGERIAERRYGDSQAHDMEQERPPLRLVPPVEHEQVPRLSRGNVRFACTRDQALLLVAACAFRLQDPMPERERSAYEDLMRTLANVLREQR